MYLEMKLKQAKLDLTHMFWTCDSQKTVKTISSKASMQAAPFCFEDLKTKTRYADVFKHQKQELS